MGVEWSISESKKGFGLSEEGEDEEFNIEFENWIDQETESDLKMNSIEKRE
jgi:hypothetical protein